MVQYIHKHCEKSGWLNLLECPDPLAIGVMIKLADRQYSREPTTLDPTTIKAVQCIGAAIAFTMVSEITATLFRQISPNQTELIIQSQGVKIPIADSLEDIIYLATTKRLSGTACILRKSKFILVWSDSVESILPYGATFEKLLCEAVSLDIQHLLGPAHSSRYSAKLRISLSTKSLLQLIRFLYHS